MICIKLRTDLLMIRINRKNIGEMILSLLVLVPYLEDSTVNSTLTLRIGTTAYLRPVNVYMGVVILLLLLRKLITIRSFQGRVSIRTALFVGFILLTMASSFLQSDNFEASFCTWIWFVEPIIYALLAAGYAKEIRMDRDNIFKYMCYFFAVYCILKLYGYVTNIGFNSGLRMRATGGGAVIFGYTIVIMFALLVSQRNKVKPSAFYAILVIYTLTAIATGSRGAIWPIVFLWATIIILDNWSTKKLLSLVLLAFLMVILIIVDVPALIGGSSANIARIISFEDISRAQTTTNSMIAFFRQPLYKIIFGAGLGNFYPYQYWSLLVQARAHNTFTVDGLQLLVQPHNSYIYMLIENGLIGLIFLIAVMVKVWKKVKISGQSNYRYLLMIILAIAFVNFFDSIFLIQPGVAGDIWIILLLLFDMASEEMNQRTKGMGLA